MRITASTLKATLLYFGLGVGLALSTIGCAQEDLPGQAPAPTDRKSPVPAAAAAAPLPSPQPVVQATKDREQFRKAVARKFDDSRVLTRELPGGDGVLHVPNGRVAHAVVGVKNADGTVRGHCVSSAAGLDALIKQAGGGQ